MPVGSGKTSPTESDLRLLGVKRRPSRPTGVRRGGCPSLLGKFSWRVRQREELSSISAPSGRAWRSSGEASSPQGLWRCCWTGGCGGGGFCEWANGCRKAEREAKGERGSRLGSAGSGASPFPTDARTLVSEPEKVCLLHSLAPERAFSPLVSACPLVLLGDPLALSRTRLLRHSGCRLSSFGSTGYPGPPLALGASGTAH